MARLGFGFKIFAGRSACLTPGFALQESPDVYWIPQPGSLHSAQVPVTGRRGARGGEVMTTGAAPKDILGRYVVGLFVAAFLAHVYFATFNWRWAFLPGHEFRQAQTAIISRYIDEQNNFTPRYETPIVGKPWVAIPLEFPFYEWSVVGLSRATGLPHYEAARTVSLACFYLMLPGAWLLLAELGLATRGRLLALALVLVCPVYIFYSRAFLMESMVLMFSVWFLLAFIRTMRERRLAWLAGCAASGTVAGLIKSTTFFVWLLPAALYGAWCLSRDLWPRADWSRVRATFGWGVAAVALPCGAVYWWVRFTDAIKETHASAYLFTSHNLTAGNTGMFSQSARFSASTWGTLFERWSEAIMAPWMIGLIIAAGVVFSPARRRPILAVAGLFLAAQSLFPFAYAHQEYYFYACAIFILGAMGLVLQGVLESALPAWLRATLVTLPLVALLANYLRVYYPIQSVRSMGGYGLTEALQAYTPKGSVIIVAGDDWSAIIPYYSHRKALMIRSGLERDVTYLDRAFNELADEDVSALVLVRKEHDNLDLVRRAAAKFNLDPAISFSHPVGDVYLSMTYRESALLRIRIPGQSFDQITTVARPAVTLEGGGAPVILSPVQAVNAFHMVVPAPRAYRFAMGYAKLDYEGEEVISMHPSADLWIAPPAGATHICWDFGIFPGAYEREGGKTDGVEFMVVAEGAGGRRREIFRRLLDPAAVSADRGRQRAEISYVGVAGEQLVFLTRPNQSISYDWAYLRRIEVK